MPGRLKRQRSFCWHVIGIIYTIFMTCFGFSTVLYFTLTREGGETLEFYEAIYSALYFSASCILIVFFIYIRLYRSQYYITSANKSSKDWDNKIDLLVIKQKEKKFKFKRRVQELPYYCMNGEGFNPYLRLGLIAFLICAVAYNILRTIGEVFHLHDCYSPGRVSFSVLQIIFFSLQTVFFCLYHRIVFLRYKIPVRFGLMHLFVTNLCTWAHTAIGEIVEEVAAHHDKHIKKINQTNATTVPYTFDDDFHNPCFIDPYTEAARPFLTPAIIEFALLSCPTIMEILRQVGKKELVSRNHEEVLEEDRKIYPLFHKSHRGFLFASILTVISVAILVILHVLKDTYISTFSYYILDIILNFAGIYVCFICMRQMHKLKFGKFPKDTFNDKILFLCLVGMQVYCAISCMSCIDLLRFKYLFSRRGRILIVLKLVGKILGLLQGIFQTFLVLDGLRRCVDNDQQIRNKHGRPHIIALLGINLSLWIFDTFQVRKADVLIKYEIKAGGHLNVMSWNSLLHTALPLMIFFRYHSTALLSIIWYKVYSKDD